MHGTPYLLLGCESGDVTVATLLDSAGAPAQGAEQAATLQLQPYEGQMLPSAGGGGGQAGTCSRLGRPPPCLQLCLCEGVLLHAPAGLCTCC